MTSAGSNFMGGRPFGADPPPPSACVHLSLTSPLLVDVINGYPLNAIDNNGALCKWTGFNSFYGQRFFVTERDGTGK